MSFGYWWESQEGGITRPEKRGGLGGGKSKGGGGKGSWSGGSGGWGKGGKGNGGELLTLTLLNTHSGGWSGASFAGSIPGTLSGDNRVFFLIGWGRGAPTTRQITAIDFAGVAGTRIARATNGATSGNAEVWTAVIPDGVFGTITATFDGTGGTSPTLSSALVLGEGWSVTPEYSNSVFSGSHEETITHSTNALVFGVVGSAVGGSTPTFTGLTELKKFSDVRSAIVGGQVGDGTPLVVDYAGPDGWNLYLALPLA